MERGIIYASQVSNGDENDLNIRVYGTKKSIEWHQEEPNDLIVKDARAPRQVWRRGNGYVTGAAADNTPESLLVIPKASLRHLQMFTIQLLWPLLMKYPENTPESRVMIFQIFAMELLEWLSLKPWSRVRNRKINGLNFPVSPNNFIYEQENRNYREQVECFSIMLQVFEPVVLS